MENIHKITTQFAALIWVLASNKKTNQNPKQTKENPKTVFHRKKKKPVLTSMKPSKSLDFFLITTCLFSSVMSHSTLSPSYLQHDGPNGENQTICLSRGILRGEGLELRQLKGRQLIQSHKEPSLSVGISPKSGPFCLLQVFPSDRQLLCWRQFYSRSA